MHAKQGWRLLKYTNSLVVHVLKARYYPRLSFLEANKGHNPSFIWNSFLERQWLFCEGVRWRVGNGWNIQVWKNTWMPILWSYRPVTRNIFLGKTLRVKGFTCPQRKWWKGEVLSSLFCLRNVEIIKKNPIMLIWRRWYFCMALYKRWEIHC